ncbi:MAG: SurA N-terminal domain-containing protein [Candidatus Aminicenantes bacterium]|jgi:peptidyl-prolyl cis-trans isomerase D
MLKAMRRNVKSLAPFLWLVIVAFIITIFAVWGGAGRLGAGRTSNTVARVKGEKISADYYFQNLAQRIEMMRNEFKDINKNLIQQLNIPQQVLEQIIQQYILLQKAKELRITVSAEELREKITSYPVFQIDGKFIGFDQYKKILEWNRIPISEFEEGIKKEVIIEKLIKILTAGITVTPEELWDSYKKKNESVKMEYVIAEADKIELEQELSSSEAQEYFNNNKEKYKIPERREASIVFLKTEGIKNEIALSDSEIEDYYQENEQQFTDPETVKVSRIYLPFEDKEKEIVEAEGQNILEKIKNGQDFAELARLHSEDEKASEGGDWGLYEWRTLSPQEQEEIEKLSEGGNSELIETDEGISILKVTEKKPPRTRPLEEVKDRIQNILKDQKAREQAEERISGLEKIARKEKSLSGAAQTSGREIINTGLLKEQEPIEDIDPSGMISRTLFQLQEKEISSPVYTYQGVGIAQLEKIEPPRQANYDEVEGEVKDDLKTQRQKDEAAEKMKKVKAELKTANLEALAQKYGLEYKTANEHKREQYLSIVGENPEIDTLAFSLPPGESSDPIEFEAGYVLIKVQDRKEVTQEDLEKDKETEKDSLLEAKRNKFFLSYMTKLREEYEVKIEYDLFLKISSDVLSRYESEE